MLNNKYRFFCVFALFCSIVLIGLGIFSKTEIMEHVVVAYSQDHTPVITADDVVPFDGLQVVLGFRYTNRYIGGYVLASNKLIKLRDGLDLSFQDMRYSVFSTGELPAGDPPQMRDMNFSRAVLAGSEMREIDFVNCSFRGAILGDVWATGSRFIDCDFTDAWISGTTQYAVGGSLALSREQLLVTSDFKNKKIKNFMFSGDLSGVDFSGFNLEGSVFTVNIDEADFSGAVITGTRWSILKRAPEPNPHHIFVPYNNLSKDQLLSTASFKNGELREVCFVGFDFSGMDLSKMDMSGCSFAVKTNFHASDLTDSIISRCIFSNVENMTLEQIKSTWNYKAGRMAGITLPPEIQAALDAENAGSER